jgi:hypothetical protein
VNDRADVIEHGVQRPLAQIDRDKTCRLSGGDGSLRTSSSVDRLRAHHEVGELAVGASPDLLGQVRSTGLEHTGDLIP